MKTVWSCGLFLVLLLLAANPLSDEFLDAQKETRETAALTKPNSSLLIPVFFVARRPRAAASGG